MSEFTKKIAENIAFSKSMWTGIYSGLYSANKKNTVPKPTDLCLGSWIVKDAIHIRNFYETMLTDYFSVPISKYQSVWYATCDLMFKNFD